MKFAENLCYPSNIETNTIDPNFTTMTNDQIESYKQDGYLIIKQLFSPEEIELLYGVATDNSVTSNSFDLNDQDGKKTKLTLWFTAGDDSFGLMSRCKRMVESVQKLLGPGEVCISIPKSCKSNQKSEAPGNGIRIMDIV